MASQVIKTNIKFKRNDWKQLYGFVTKVGDSWRGCHEEDNCKKKIVYVDYYLEVNMRPGLLYHVAMIPMHDKDGFIAVEARQVKFNAKIETHLEEGNFQVLVKFGHKVFIYDPTSKSKKKNDMFAIANLIRERQDLNSSFAVADEFLDNAMMAYVLYKKQE